MSEQVIEGIWEQVAGRYDLRGRRVRVTLTDNGGPAAAVDNAWVRQLREWAASHAPVALPVAGNRESIYEGSLDDPR